MNRKYMNFCQSCGMPQQNNGDFGTNADGSKNYDYCAYCYQDGTFIEPDISMQEMVDKCTHIMSEMKQIPESEARAMNMQFIPYLKRWK
ncbi:zinc ribbon domain-containing protein [Methanolobus sp.]|uniref:zinc ribbon domain-containing protein n=1 Tax=Methanolobus sp. TaxID=1874737 RepID=UPI0025DD8F38|nr:zinc ribbon domain-containing protein [Methanolobus sp.]